MPKHITAKPEFTVTQIAKTTKAPSWHIAIFAHNEVTTIDAAMQSVASATAGKDAAVYVLANGCKDSTASLVKQNNAQLENLYILETSVADKANAWNLFVHRLLTTNHTHENHTYFFMDGDVICNSDTFSLLAEEFNLVERAEAVGAMPANGRDRDAWRRRMVSSNMLAGNCYALRGRLVKYLQLEKILIPIGLIGEDFFVSWLVQSNVWRKEQLENEGNRCVFHNKAEFSFRSLSIFKLSDYSLYIRRKWRYTLRGIQHQMLLFLMHQRDAKLPENVIQLYNLVPPPPRLKWRGLDTPFWILIVGKIKRLHNSIIL
ncbi:glycosyltransferase [Paraglaciecola sp. L3A3]|uniref:glycosyltransferase n=1 Tax=Paraglaciecola sp. L3A3 TaxID=2686358 RepID=UPI00131E67F6|nr:glycosyltransferase [Paraglaciecola sp. L3A3]